MPKSYKGQWEDKGICISSKDCFLEGSQKGQLVFDDIKG